MPQASKLTANPWDEGLFRGQPQALLFGVMHEDPLIELAAFPPHRRVFCIASAGCTARALSAAGHNVTAVDTNPQQILYAQARASGAPIREGAAEHLLTNARSLFPALGWTASRLREFLCMYDPAEQLSYWRRTLDTARWRAAVHTVLSPWLLGLAYRSPFLACLPRRFASVLRSRFERTWSSHPNASNPFAWRLLLGETPPSPDSPQRPPSATLIRFVCADAASYLEKCRPSSFDAFSLSNIADGAPLSYVQRLCKATRHAASPGALVVTRSFAEPATALENNLADQDRSLVWGTVHITEAENLCSTF